MQYTEYAPSKDEKEMGLEYRSPKPRFVDRVRENLQRMGDRLGQQPPAAEPPERGFLVKSLANHQRKRLNEILAPQLALRATAQHQELKNVPIVECNEPMVSLPESLAEHGLKWTASERGFHKACGSYGSTARILYVRYEVADKFAQVTKALHELSLMPHIEDCWRPWQVQKGLLIRRIVDLSRKYCEWDWRTVKSVANSFTAASPGLAGHQAGAAIDTRIRQMKKEKDFLRLGNEYTEGGVYSAFNSPHVTASQWRTRMYFITAMMGAGFKLLATENWHGSFGDRGMTPSGDVMMSSARYGPIEGFSTHTGKVCAYSPRTVEHHFLTDQEYEDLVCMSREKGSDTMKFTFSETSLYAKFLAEESENSQS